MSFEENEIEQASKLLNITKEEFMHKYIEETVEGYDLKEKPCCFLAENGTCEIKEFKPEGCKDYPFTNKPERLFLNSPKELSLADLSVKIFENHYNARFGMAQAIPVAIYKISIRLLWAIKSRFYSDKSWKECIPIGSHPDLRRMLLTGHGVLCLVDGIDAAARSKGQILFFALHLNFVAWKRLAFSGLMEIRALYKENCIDIAVLEEDLRNEWDRLYEWKMV